jgi:hypothetical protein
MNPPFAVIANRAGGPGRVMRLYCARVRVVDGTSTPSSASDAMVRCAACVTWDSGLLS